MATLTLRLLGAPQVQYGGQALSFRSRKVLALLIFLVVEGGQHERDKLADLFWPEGDQPHGRTALRNTLARLRQSLAEAGECLITEGSRVGFDFAQPTELDLRAVEAAVSALSSATPLEELQAALARVDGEFLEGFSVPDAPEFETWASGLRERCHRRGEALFAALAARQLEQAHFADALDTATRWARYAPLAETAYRCLIEAHALAGDRSAALQAYDTCRRLLADELGVPPSAETTALVERVKQDAMARAQRERDRLPHALLDATASNAPLLIPFVGRTEEYGRLVAHYRQAAQGTAQAVALVGEAGIGKTRLAEAFLDWVSLTETPADVLRGRAFEIGGHLPYQPVVDAMRHRLERENAPDDLLDDVWLAELSQLLPELRSRYPDLPAPMAGNADFVQARLFEAVTHLTLALAGRQPLALFIDDAQWADTGSQDLLHYVARRWAETQTPAILVLTVRQEALLTMPDLREWLAGLGRLAPLARLELGPLSPQDLHQLVGTLDQNGQEAGRARDQLTDWLNARTGGSPFFLAEMLQMLREQGTLVGAAGPDGCFQLDAAATLRQLQSVGQVSIPPNVRALILSRLGHLSEQARALLLAGAVIGRQCTFERLCQVARTEEFAGLPALEELLNSRLLLELEGQRPYRFAHDNVRDVVYTEAGAARRRLYHRQAFTALEQADAPPAELALHAGLAGLCQPAFDYAIVAGDNAMAIHAFADAVTFYAQAFRVADQATTNSTKLTHLCVRLGRSLELSGRYQDALEHYGEASTNARQTGNRELELAALVGRGTIRSTANELSDFVLGEALGQEALALARQLNDKAAEAKIQWNLLNVYRMTGRNRQALAAGEQSLALARELNLREQMAYAANDLVYVVQASGDMGQMVSLAETATALWRELGNQPMLTDSLVILANGQAMCGCYDAAIAIAAEALEISRALENKWAISYSLYTYSLVYWRTLVVGPAHAAMNESIELAHQVGFTGAQVLVRLFQAQMRLALGDVANARELAESAARIAVNSIPLFLPAAQGVLALTAIEEGEVAAADQIITAHSFKDLPFSLMNFLTPEMSICCHALSLGNFAEAHTLSAVVLAHLHEQNLRMYIPDFCYVQGRALIGLNRNDEARAVLDKALAILRETGGRFYLCEITGLLADLEEQAGHIETAAILRHETRATLDFIVEHIPASDLKSLSPHKRQGS